VTASPSPLGGYLGVFIAIVAGAGRLSSCLPRPHALAHARPSSECGTYNPWHAQSIEFIGRRLQLRSEGFQRQWTKINAPITRALVWPPARQPRPAHEVARLRAARAREGGTSAALGARAQRHAVRGASAGHARRGASRQTALDDRLVSESLARRAIGPAARGANGLRQDACPPLAAARERDSSCGAQAFRRLHGAAARAERCARRAACCDSANPPGRPGSSGRARLRHWRFADWRRRPAGGCVARPFAPGRDSCWGAPSPRSVGWRWA